MHAPSSSTFVTFLFIPYSLKRIRNMLLIHSSYYPDSSLLATDLTTESDF